MTPLTLLMLAAGQSRRFGAADKLTALLHGQPVIGHILAAQAGLTAKRVAVVGPDSAAAGLLSAAGFRLVVNPAPDSGQGASLALGAAAVGCGRVLVMLGDMPFVTHDLLSRLATCERRAVADDGQRRSPPALFLAADRPALLAAKGERGARELLAEADPVRAEPDELIDVDTPDAMQVAEARFAAIFSLPRFGILDEHDRH